MRMLQFSQVFLSFHPATFEIIFKPLQVHVHDLHACFVLLVEVHVCFTFYPLELTIVSGHQHI